MLKSMYLHVPSSVSFKNCHNVRQNLTCDIFWEGEHPCYLKTCVRRKHVTFMLLRLLFERLVKFPLYFCHAFRCFAKSLAKLAPIKNAMSNKPTTARHGPFSGRLRRVGDILGLRWRVTGHSRGVSSTRPPSLTSGVHGPFSGTSVRVGFTE